MAKSEAKSQAGKEFIAFEEHVLQSQPTILDLVALFLSLVYLMVEHDLDVARRF